MFEKVSMTGTGIVVSLAVLVVSFLEAYGVTVTQNEVVEVINGLAGFVGFILVIWGQVRRKDLKAGLLRK